MKLAVPGIVGEEFSGEEVRECLYPELEGEHLAADYYRQSLHTEIYKIKIRFFGEKIFSIHGHWYHQTYVMRKEYAEKKLYS